MMKKIVLLVVLISLPPYIFAEAFVIEVIRDNAISDLRPGSLYVNNKLLGQTYENELLRIQPGEYKGVLRYVSGKGFAQGPFGTMGQEGDFLIEIAGVTWSDGKKRDNLLFHGGIKPVSSKGCIMLGAVSRDANGARYLAEGHTLRKLRQEFYGAEDPNMSPNVQIVIKIVE